MILNLLDIEENLLGNGITVNSAGGVYVQLAIFQHQIRGQCPEHHWVTVYCECSRSNSQRKTSARNRSRGYIFMKLILAFLN